MSVDVLLKEEVTQVSGIVILLDFTDFGMAHAVNWDRAAMQNMVKCWQVSRFLTYLTITTEYVDLMA